MMQIYNSKRTGSSAPPPQQPLIHRLMAPTLAANKLQAVEDAVTPLVQASQQSPASSPQSYSQGPLSNFTPSILQPDLNALYAPPPSPQGPLQSSPQVSPATSAALPNVKTTQYGWAGDTNPGYKYDVNSNVKHIGAFDSNPLTPGAAALSPSLEQKLDAKPGDTLALTDSNGNRQLVYFADRTAQDLKDDRVDLFQPNGLNKNIADFHSIENLGGGSAGLKGQALAQYGASQVQGQQAPSLVDRFNDAKTYFMNQLHQAASAVLPSNLPSQSKTLAEIQP